MVEPAAYIHMAAEGNLADIPAEYSHTAVAAGVVDNSVAAGYYPMDFGRVDYS